MARRALILGAQVTHAMAWPPPETLRQVMASSSEEDRRQFMFAAEQAARQFVQRLRASGLWGDMTGQEQAFLTVPALERTDQQWLDATWAIEGVACLVWALGVIDSLPAYDTQSDPDLVRVVPNATDREVAATLTLRSPEQLAAARDAAERWHWRSRTRQLIESHQPLPALPEGLTIDTIVRMAAEHAVTSGEIPATIDGDFPAFGKAYKALSEVEYSIATSIAMERHRALNWLCGRAPRLRWDRTPTDT